MSSSTMGKLGNNQAVALPVLERFVRNWNVISEIWNLLILNLLGKR